MSFFFTEVKVKVRFRCKIVLINCVDNYVHGRSSEI